MSNGNITVSWCVGQIDMPSAGTLIANAEYPLTAGQHDTLQETVEAECHQLANAIRDREYASLQDSESVLDVAAQRLEMQRKCSEEARQAAAAEPANGNWLKVAIWSLCALACFAAEFVLSWNALCYVLNVPHSSILGVLLGLAPPSALAVFEIVLARLFEEPWQKARALAGSRRAVTAAAMYLLLSALAVGNVITIVHLAKAREEALRVAREYGNPDSGDETVSVDQAAIDRAVLWVSLVVSLDGAVFLMLSLQEGVSWRRRLRLKNADRAAKAECRSLEAEWAGLRAQVESARHAFAAVDEKSSLAADRYRAHCSYLVAEKSAAACRLHPLEQLVDYALRRKLET
jgi:hypothetical protein